MTSLEWTVLLTHAAATWFMVGVIWFVQVVHYPLMARVGRGVFCEYEAAHMRRTSWVVMPPMLLELATGAYLAWQPPASLVPLVCQGGLLLLLLIWVSTALLQVPRHQGLAARFDPADHRALVRTNWLRTAAWTVRGGLVLLLLAQASAGGALGGR